MGKLVSCKCGTQFDPTWAAYDECPTCRAHHVARFLSERQRCGKCDLSRNCLTNCMRGVGATHADVMIIGEAPGYREDRKGAPFLGDAGACLNDLIKSAGWKRSEIFITNVCKCRPPNNATPKVSHIKACMPYLENEINSVNPKLIVALGNVAMRAVLNTTGIMRAHGDVQWSDTYNTWVLPCLHPAYLLRTPTYTDITKQELKLGAYVAVHNRLPPKDEVKYEYTDGLSDAIKMLELVGKSEKISFDIEAYGLNPWKCKGICSFAFTISEHTGFGIDIRKWDTSTLLKFKPFLADILSKKHLKIIHNFEYEYKMLRRFFGIIIAPKVFDTVVAHHLCYEEYPHDLETLATLHCNMPNHKQEFVTLTNNYADMDIPTTEELLGYNCADTDATYRLYNVLVPWMRKEGVVKLFDEITMPLCHVLAEVTYTGVHIDTVKLHQVAAKYADIITNGKRAIALLTDDLKFNPLSPKQVSGYFYENKGYNSLKCSKTTQEPSADKESLEHIVSTYNDPVARLILEVRKYVKLKSTYLDGGKTSGGLLQYVDGESRIHTQYLVHGTTTGRPSSKAPNLQNQSRSDDIRGLFTATAGTYLLDADYSQLELRIAAYYSKDPHLLSAYILGLDLHSIVATDCLGADPQNVDKDLRTAAKAINFGIIYGMGPKGLAADITTKRGRICTEDEAAQYIHAYFERYEKLRDFVEAIKNTVLAGQALVTIYGNKRRFTNIKHMLKEPHKYSMALSEAVRTGQNFPIQGTAGHTLSDATVRVDAAIKASKMPMSIVLTVHDELLFEVREDVPHAEATQLVRENMENPEIFGGLLPFPVDIEITRAWKQKD